MTYETAVAEFFRRFPDLRAKYSIDHDDLGNDAPPDVVFASILIPALESALEQHDLKGILTISAYLEDAAESAGKDPRLQELLRIEIGEWLGGMANEDVLAPWLGAQTKQVCGYVPGIATQRRQLRTDKQQNRLSHRIASLVKGLFSR